LREVGGAQALVRGVLVLVTSSQEEAAKWWKGKRKMRKRVLSYVRLCFFLLWFCFVRWDRRRFAVSRRLDRRSPMASSLRYRPQTASKMFVEPFLVVDGVGGRK
jgi:hypothetical protein